MKSIFKEFFLPFLLLSVFTNCSVFAQTAIERAGESYVKTSLNAYSFNALLMEGKKGEGKGIDLYDLLNFCAENNFEAVDITGYYFPEYPEVPSDEYIYSIKRRAFQLGLDISGIGVRNDFAIPDAEKRADDVKLVKEWIEVAEKLGAPVIRVFAGKIPDGYEARRDEIAGYMAESLKECADYGRQHGVLVGVQNHGGFLQTAEQCIDLVRRVNSDWFGLIVDSGNFLTDDPYADIRKVLPYAVNFQLKESPFNPVLAIKTDLNRFMKIVKESGYRGYLPVETLEVKGHAFGSTDLPYDPFTLVPEFLKEVKTAIKEEYDY